MRNVDIEVFPIAKTKVDTMAVRRWLDYLHVSPDYTIPVEEIVPDPSLLVAMAAKRCYMSFEIGLNPNVTRVRSDWTEYLDNILKSGHGSVLEHGVYTFAVEGVSRVFTAEMNRHRAGVGISEGSMRYIRYSNIPWWMPPSMQLTDEERRALDCVNHWNDMTAEERNRGDVPPDFTFTLAKLARKKYETQLVFREHYDRTEQNYSRLEGIWAEELAPTSQFHGKKQVTSMMRRIIPMGVATGEVLTLNLRALRHVIALRASEGAEEEIAYVFGKIAKIMVESEPQLFGDFAEIGDGLWVPKYAKV